MSSPRPTGLMDQARLGFRYAADFLAHPLVIVAGVLLWVPWMVTGPDWRTIMDHFWTGGAFTGFQMVLAGQMVERAANAAQQAELVHATPGADDEMADADKMTLGEIEERREEKGNRK